MAIEAAFDRDTQTVHFTIYPKVGDDPSADEGQKVDDGRRVVGRITREALRDRFGAADGEAELICSYRAHPDVIDAKALEKYRLAPGKPIRLNFSDFE